MFRLTITYICFQLSVALFSPPASAAGMANATLEWVRLVIRGGAAEAPQSIKLMTKRSKWVHTLRDGVVVLKEATVSRAPASLVRYSPAVLLRQEFPDGMSAPRKIWISLVVPRRLTDSTRLLHNVRSDNQPYVILLRSFEEQLANAIKDLKAKDPMFKMNALKEPYLPFLRPTKISAGNNFDNAISDVETISVYGETHFVINFLVDPRDELTHVMAFLGRMADLKVLTTKR